MKRYKGVIRKSRTLDAAAVVAILGAVQLNWPLLQEALGPYYGVSYIVIAAVMAGLRYVTTGPVGEKDDAE